MENMSGTHFFFKIGMYFLAFAKLAALFFLLIFAFRSRVPLRARYRTGIMDETVGSDRNRLPKSVTKGTPTYNICSERTYFRLKLTEHFAGIGQKI